jgi:hypothetical protein
MSGTSKKRQNNGVHNTPGNNKKGNPIKKKCETSIVKLLSHLHSKCGTGKVLLNAQVLCTVLVAGGLTSLLNKEIVSSAKGTICMSPTHSDKIMSSTIAMLV